MESLLTSKRGLADSDEHYDSDERALMSHLLSEKTAAAKAARKFIEVAATLRLLLFKIVRSSTLNELLGPVNAAAKQKASAFARSVDIMSLCPVGEGTLCGGVLSLGH